MLKKLKENKGFTGVDISISVIIILIFIPTVFGIIYNIQKNDAMVERKSNAISIASDVIEKAKMQEYTAVTTNLEDAFSIALKNKYEQSDYKNEEKEEIGYTYMYFLKSGKRNEHYQIQVGIKNYYPSEEETNDYIKIVKVRVFYSYANTVKDIDLSTVIKKDK